MPNRIQRKRSKGWKMPAGAVYVGRGSKWGNPFVVDLRGGGMPQVIAVQSFREFVLKHGSWSPIPTHKWPKGKIPANWTTVDEAKAELRGKDLACWCRPDEMCHADVLMEIANL